MSEINYIKEQMGYFGFSKYDEFPDELYSLLLNGSDDGYLSDDEYNQLEDLYN